MNNEELIVNNEKSNVGAGLVSAQKNTTINNARPFKTTHGITLIALIITIIVMLILVGVVLNLSIGERGIFNIAKLANEKYEEAEAREKLELVLVDLQTDKITDKTYNEKEYIDKKIRKNNMEVNENIVDVGVWRFEIDRSVPQIAASLGRNDGIVENSKANLIAGNTLDGQVTLKIDVATQNDTIKMIEIYDETNNKIETINVPGGIKQIQKEQSIYVEFMEDKTYYAEIIGNNSNITTNTVAVQKNENAITSAKDLQKLASIVNEGQSTFEGKTIIQVRDIDLSTVCSSTTNSWNPIGYAGTNSYWFDGTYDGKGNEITNVYVNNNDDKSVGLFGFLGYKGKLHKLTVSGEVTSTADRFTGGIVGRNEGTIENCTNNVAVNNISNGIGGIAGGNINTIKNCINNGNITGGRDGTGGIIGSGNWTIADIVSASNVDIIKPAIVVDCVNSSNATIKGKVYVGGICGIHRECGIEGCTNEGTVIATSSIAGGIAGESATDITNCKNKGNVTTKANPSNQLISQGTGGIVGRTKGTVNCSSNTGNITTEGYFVGGIAGFAETGTQINKSYNYNGNIYAKVNAAGGIIGRCDGGTVKNCYNYLSSNDYFIKVEGTNVAGIIGAISYVDISNKNYIQNCYNIGDNITSVSHPTYSIGKIIGVTYDETEITNTYYNDTNSIPAIGEANPAISGAITTKTQVDFQTNATNTDSVTYALNNNATQGIWGQNSSINGGYPYLIENQPE